MALALRYSIAQILTHVTWKFGAHTCNDLWCLPSWEGYTIMDSNFTTLGAMLDSERASKQPYDEVYGNRDIHTYVYH